MIDPALPTPWPGTVFVCVGIAGRQLWATPVTWLQTVVGQHHMCPEAGRIDFVLLKAMGQQQFSAAVMGQQSSLQTVAGQLVVIAVSCGWQKSDLQTAMGSAANISRNCGTQDIVCRQLWISRSWLKLAVNEQICLQSAVDQRTTRILRQLWYGSAEQVSRQLWVKRSCQWTTVDLHIISSDSCGPARSWLKPVWINRTRVQIAAISNTRLHTPLGQRV